MQKTYIEAANVTLQVLEAIRISHPELIADNMPAGWGMDKLRGALQIQLQPSQDQHPALKIMGDVIHDFDGAGIYSVGANGALNAMAHHWSEHLNEGHDAMILSEDIRDTKDLLEIMRAEIMSRIRISQSCDLEIGPQPSTVQHPFLKIMDKVIHDFDDGGICSVGANGALHAMAHHWAGHLNEGHSSLMLSKDIDDTKIRLEIMRAEIMSRISPAKKRTNAPRP